MYKEKFSNFWYIVGHTRYFGRKISRVLCVGKDNNGN